MFVRHYNKQETISPIISESDDEMVSEEVNDIITAVPAWIVRWGITIVFSVLGSIVVLSAIINYPEVVKTTLKVNSLNAPKIVLTHASGKLVRLLVIEDQKVTKNQPLGYLESVARPQDVLLLETALKDLRLSLNNGTPTETQKLPNNLELGELQGAYQSFHQQFSQYLSTLKDGYYIKKHKYLTQDLKDILVLKKQLLKRQQIQKREYDNIEREYKAYQELYRKKIISRSEFSQQENKYLASKYPLDQTETSFTNNSSTYNAKKKELLDLEYLISEKQSDFLQALNKCITETETWISKYVLKAPISGRVTFAGIVQQGQNVISEQEVFVINPGNTNFFGEMEIPQYNMGKINLGEKVLVKLHSYPFEQYGMIRGNLSYISDVAFRDSVFIAKVTLVEFENKDPKRRIVLKNGMLADAEIITDESSLLQRFFRKVTRILNNS